MKLSEELIWRGFQAETTVSNPADLDTRESKKFYWGADPSADSLTIGNLAALMMCACFVRHGYKPYLLVGGATGQIGDPKDTSERELKPLSEVEHNKNCIRAQIERVMRNYLEACAREAASEGGASGGGSVSDGGAQKLDLTMVDNLDWFSEIKFLDFLREVGKSFSMTQLMDRKFIQTRMGEGGSGISYAEFSYTLIQGYDFLHLYRKYGVALQLCGADQFGNCSSGIHLIRRLEGADADAWSTPLIIDPVSGRKFGKSEGNAVWLADGTGSNGVLDDGSASGSTGGSANYTTVFDFYQFWLNQADEAVEYLMKIYTVYPAEKIERILSEHAAAPEKRLAQRMLAAGATEVVHGREKMEGARLASERLFSKEYSFSEEEILALSKVLPVFSREQDVLSLLVSAGLATSKGEARKLIKAGAVSFNGQKIDTENYLFSESGVLKKGKNRFAVIR